MADRRHERGHVVNAADQDRADENPEQCWNPTEHDAGQDRTDDRPRRGDGREMLAEQEFGLDRNVVHVVAQFDGRSVSATIETKQPR